MAGEGSSGRKPEKNPIIPQTPMALTAALLSKIINRIETIAPVDKNSESDIIKVETGAFGGFGTNITANFDQKEVRVCIDNVPTTIKVFVPKGQ